MLNRTAFIDAYTLGYLKAALKKRIDSNLVDELFAEAEQAARESLVAREWN